MPKLTPSSDDLQNQIFVIKNAGFVAYGIEGTYNVLAVVDQTHLPVKPRIDPLTNVTLGYVYEVKMTSQMRSRKDDKPQEYVVAMLYVHRFTLDNHSRCLIMRAKSEHSSQ